MKQAEWSTTINPIPTNIAIKSLTPPSSLIPNSFPRNYIGTTENILFESKPSFLAYFLSGGGIAYLIFIVFICLIVVGLIIFFLVSAPGVLVNGIIFLLIFLILFVFIPIALLSLSYKRTYYALTDSRILVAHGILNKRLISATYDMVTAIDVWQPWLMSKVTKVGFIRFSVPSFRTGTILWSFIKQPTETYQFILDIKNIYDYAKAVSATYSQANIYGNVMAANMGNQKRCISCGSYIKASAKFCPKCGTRQP
ncbi:MAG: zinc-ribbon domain-containing protein [Thermoplasmatales archaeon]